MKWGVSIRREPREQAGSQRDHGGAVWGPVWQRLGHCSSAYEEFRLSQGTQARVCCIAVNHLFSSHVIHAAHGHQHSHPAVGAGGAGGEGSPAAGISWKRSGQWSLRAKAFPTL